MTEAVKVMVRCRPINRRQKQLNCEIVVNVDQKQNQINLYKPNCKQDPKSFSFDNVFNMSSLQSSIYEQTAFSLVDSVIQGYNGTIFAYGQTGCGKTHTMMGSDENQTTRGIIPRTFSQIITFTNSESEKKHLVQCSFIQIYNEQIHDLLGKNIKARMDLKQSPDKGVFVKDLTMNIVKTTSEMQHLMDIGFKNRATRETAMNKQSSRSHSIFTIHIESQEIDQFGKQKFKAGKLNLVDLAGSQRQSKTNATGDGMKEAAKINLSLSALGNVISALVDGKVQHIPYRDSKLTRLLQDSLGGNTKTIMIAAISPASDNYQQTLSTLRYASRAKFIQNKPIINEDPKDTLLRQYADEIKALKMMLQGKAPIQMQMQMINGGGGETRYIQVNKNDEKMQDQLNSKQERIRIEQQQKQKLREQLESLQNLISHNKLQNEEEKQELERIKKLKQKMKVQKKKQQELRMQKKRKEEQLFAVEQNYQSLNEQVEQMRIKFKQIKKKYVQALQQVKDLREESQRDKQQFLDAIRYQGAQVSKYSRICSIMLSQTQIEQILAASDFDEQSHQWTIAPFVYRDRNVSFPKFSAKNSELMQFEKDKKQLVFKQLNRKQEQIKLKSTYRISQVVRGAREAYNQLDVSGSSTSINLPTSSKQRMNTKTSLTLAPLKVQNELKFKNDQVYSANSLQTLGQKQKKLNPLNGGFGSRRDVGKADGDFGWN